jgi:hypothetical protein
MKMTQNRGNAIQINNMSIYEHNDKWFFCVGVMYSGEYDACDATLSVYPHRASLKNMPDHGVKSRGFVSHLIVMYIVFSLKNYKYLLLLLVMPLWVYIHTGQAWKICLTTVGIEFFVIVLFQSLSKTLLRVSFTSLYLQICTFITVSHLYQATNVGFVHFVVHS